MKKNWCVSNLRNFSFKSEKTLDYIFCHIEHWLDSTSLIKFDIMIWTWPVIWRLKGCFLWGKMIHSIREIEIIYVFKWNQQQSVAGQGNPHMCVWPLNMYLLQNIQEDLSDTSFIHVPGTQLYWQKSLNVFEAREHV